MQTGQSKKPYSEVLTVLPDPMELLEKLARAQWTICGLGFIRAYVEDGRDRVHIWHDGFRLPGVTDIHTHPWAFTSFLLAGSIHNTRYSLYADKPIVDAEPYYQAEIVTGTGSGADDYRPVWIKPLSEQWLTRGDYYRQQHFEVHRTDAQPGTLTYVQREIAGRKTGLCYWHRGAQYVSPAPRLATAEEVDLGYQAAIEQIEHGL